MNLKKFWRKAKHVLAFVLAIALFFNGWANYDFSVLAAGLSVTLSADEAVYTGGDLKPSITSVKEGDVDVAYTDADVTWTDASGQTVNGAIQNAGVYTATVSVTEDVLDADGNATGEKTTRSGSAQFTVKPLDITGFNVNVAGSYTYTGTAIVPAVADVTVTSGNATVDKSLYTVAEVTNNVNAGNASIKVKAADGNANVTGEATGIFTINPVVFDVVWNIGDYEYDGKTNYFPTATVAGITVDKRNTATKIVNGVTVTLSTSVDTTVDPGKYEAILTLNDNSGNYKIAEGFTNCAYNVAKKALSESNVAISSDSAVANGKNQVPSVTVTVDGKTLVENKDYNVTKATEMITAGKYDIKVVGQGNYESEVTKPYVIYYANDAGATVDVKGNTFKSENGVYTGQVMIIPSQGYYKISESETGNYGDSLTYDVDSTIPAKLYLQNVNKNGEISEIDFPVSELSFDDTIPTLSVTGPDVDTWTDSKEIAVTSDGTGSNCYVYYSKDEKVELVSPISAATDLSKLSAVNGNLIIAENIANLTTYYFYAVDDAGNVVTSDAVVVDKVDVEAPKTSIDVNNTLQDKKDANGSYWKSTADFVIPVTVTDNLSGISSITVTGTAVLDCPIAADKLSATGTVTITEPGTYTISVVDEAGLTAVEQSFVVEADTKAPEVALSEPTGEGKYLNSSTNVYWFSENAINVPLSVTDELGATANEKLSSYKVVYSTDAAFATSTEVMVDAGAGTAVITIDEKNAEKAITYYFKAVDFAGNESAIQSVQLGYDNSPVDITLVELTQLNGDEWINAAEFAGESKVAFDVQVTDAQTGIKKIEYSSDGGATYAEATYTQTGDVYSFITNEAYADGVNYQWQVRVTNNVEVSAEKEVAAGLGKIDVTAPEAEAYIQFFADTVGSNDLGSGNEDGKGGWASNILGMVGNAWNKIWGYKTINFEVYVKDATSRIAGPESVVMTYTKTGSTTAEVIKLENVPGVQAFDANDIQISKNLEKAGYAIFKGTISVKEDALLSVSDFRIASITDVAGNIRENIILNGAEEDDIIYIDAETPKLVSVSYTDAGGNSIDPTNADADRDFYTETVYATFQVKERFFGEDGNYPVIKLNKTYIAEDGTVSTDKDTIKTLAEEWVYGSDYTYIYKLTSNTVAGLKLELQSGTEVEYDFTLSYTDPSGNILTANSGISGVENGVYSSREIVIDNLAPKLLSYEVNEPTEYSVNGAAIYENVDGADLSIKFTINDNASYYALSKGNLVANLYIDGQDPVMLIPAIPENGVAGREHIFEVEYDGNDIENIVYVELSYADEAGIALVNDTDLTAVSGKEGTYKSGEYIIDHVAPVLVSAEIDNADVVETPEYGKYFYNSEQILELTIDERFFAENNAPIIKPTVTLNRREGAEAEFVGTDMTDKVVWEADGENWKTTITLAEGTSNEYEYQVVVEYADASGNALTGNGVSEGIFESRIFVIDTISPEVTSYSFEQATCEVPVTDGNATVLRNNTEKDADDLKVTFTLNDNETYYENVSKDYLLVELFRDGEAVEEMKLDDLNLEEHGEGTREFTYSFSYDGEADTENEFHVEISYRDAAENNLVKNDLSDTDGVYKSSKYIIDHIAPRFNIEYSEAHRVIKINNGLYVEEIEDGAKVPVAGYHSFYNDSIDVKLTFDEKYFNTIDESDTLEHFEIVVTKNKEIIETPDIIWKHDGISHTAEFTIVAEDDHSTDGNYQFEVKYQDCAENSMLVEENSNQLGIKANSYKSPVLVLDTTNPEIKTTYGKDGFVQTYKGVDYFNTTTTFKVEVTDRNIYYQELVNSLNKTTLTDINDNLVDKGKFVIEPDDDLAVLLQGANEQTAKVTLKLLTEANYAIPVAYTDPAGNIANIKVINPDGEDYYCTAEDYEFGYTEYATVDTDAPEIDLKYTTTDFANYWEWGYWFDKKAIKISATITDNISGVQKYKYIIKDEKGKLLKESEVDCLKEGWNPEGIINLEVEVPIPDTGADFKGTVTLQTSDYAENFNEFTRSHIVESASKHSETGTAEITTITSPSRTVNGIPFYNTDVKFKLLLQDTHSGLAKWEYIGGNTLADSKDYKSSLVVNPDKVSQPVQGAPGIEYEMITTLTLDAQANNENDILVKAWFTDNVGYNLDVEETYNIDITKPIITVEYDLNNPANGRYYKETRTATVKIRERNFDAADVQFLFTSTDGPKPEISGWTHSGTGDDTIHTCTVTFSQDSDYTFTVKFMDMAGNVADYNRVDDFTIDKTKPVATITYDNNSYLNEYYYDAARTATIDILEHNFDPTGIEIMVTADGSTVGVPHISAWSHNGDHNIATITFSADAEYTFDIAGVDLALNELDDYTPDHFVVDQTAPELEIFDIEHMSANNGVVRPGIRYDDTNYDKDGTVILMTGYNNGVVEMTGARKLEANGLELKLDDFAYVQEMDDLYTMEATVYDLAGNSSEAMVMFSVNRFGSVYTFDKATDALIGDNGKYYTNKEQELVITETNVDTLEFKEITMNLNGKLTTLKEGVDYTVRLEGNDATWKQYTYTLKAENFVEEGTYILTIYSEDRATNTSDNNTKGKKVEFVVDKTNPSALISGVENGGQYRANNKEVTIDVEDNVRLSQVVVTIDGVEAVYDAAQINEVDGKLVLNISSANHWQDVKVVVTDAAGNEEISEEMRVLVTANIFVQFFMNKPVFYGTLGGGAVLAALLWWFLVGKKKKKEEQAQ